MLSIPLSSSAHFNAVMIVNIIYNTINICPIRVYEYVCLYIYSLRALMFDLFCV